MSDRGWGRGMMWGFLAGALCAVPAAAAEEWWAQSDEVEAAPIEAEAATVEATEAEAIEAAEAATVEAAQAEAAAPAPLSAEDFLATAFAEAFRAREYATALAIIEGLELQYPGDPLVRRYHAITLDRVGRFEDALTIFEELLRETPSDIPTRYFYGETLYRSGHDQEALQQWEWVEQNSPVEDYRQWARTLIERVSAIEQEIAEKRWYVVTSVGGEYDTNASLKPNDKALASTADPNAFRYTGSLVLGYRAVIKPATRVDLLSITRQSLHDDSLNELNFTSQELAVDMRQRYPIGSQNVIWGLRLSDSFGFLNGNLFSINYEALANADTVFLPRTRSVFYARLRYSEFGPDGSNPPQTSRDGLYHDYGTTQYVYSTDYQRYLFLSHELNFTDPRGANFDRFGQTSRVGVHTPLWPRIPVLLRTDVDVSVGFQWARYPRFTSLSSLDPTRRRDLTWDLYVGFTHHLTPNWDIRAYYRLINADNRNDFFQYDRQIGGVQVIFTKSF